MGTVLKFPDKGKKQDVVVPIRRGLPPSCTRDELSERIIRIKESLIKINELMVSLRAVVAEPIKDVKVDSDEPK